MQSYRTMSTKSLITAGLESLALAAECDEIAIRYKALVKAYQSAYGAKEE